MDNMLYLKCKGGVSEEGVISLRVLATISTNLQNITSNSTREKIEKKLSPKERKLFELYLTDYKKGSVDLNIKFLFDSYHAISNDPLLSGVLGAGIYDLIKKMAANLHFESEVLPELKKLTRQLYENTNIAAQLLREETYDKFIETKTKIQHIQAKINSLYSVFKSVSGIAKVIGAEVDEILLHDGRTASIKIDRKEKTHLKQLEKEKFQTDDNIVISGIPVKMSHRDKSVYVKNELISNIKLYVSDDMFDEIIDPFRRKAPITIRGRAIIKMGDFVKTREIIVTEILKND